MTMILIGHMINFLKILLPFADKHVPVIKYTKKEAKLLAKPWITNRMKKVVKVRDRLLKKMKRNKGEANTQFYKKKLGIV